MKITNDGKKMVYKRVPYEVFEMVTMMSKNNLNRYVKIVYSYLSGNNTIVVKKTDENQFEIIKYNGLGNKFEYTLKTDSEHNIDFSDVNLRFEFDYSFKRGTTIDKITKSLKDSCKHCKCEMKMSKCYIEDVMIM